MSKKISMQLIADRLGISKYSVSQALSGKQGVSEETRAKVLEMAKAMGYRINSKKHKPQTETNKTPNKVNPFIFVWIHSSKLDEPYFWNQVLAGIVNGCGALGWNHLIISNSGEDPEFAFPSYADRASCLGMIVIGSLPVSFLLSIKKMELPVVLADHEEPLSDLDCVVFSNFDAAKSMCRRLIAEGSKSIIFVGSDDYAVSFKERWWGCRIAVDEENRTGPHAVALDKWDLPYEGGWIPMLKSKISSLAPGSIPDSYICANDQIAVELLNQLKQAGFSIPEQSKVVGFDNIDRAAYSEPSLTTVELGKEVLGYRAVDALQHRLSKPGMPPEKIVLSFRLISRQSG
ncbi:LacI family DNA-binding transcriptional regulator [Paenibacillus filicis]|uniref:LacI family DNA-binding transcriptional regulator n=1 Tax=Paenibacillus gyeongsangnamensis TaxID=3388067 RepID=A0ABT4QJ30_9BACL|nr:LacI family DNA-binding transcriptional regulator [Paenibacillus filicis]MCZ8516888.1 LacI family DNA-binding transcriptional regulator [Paenibacillus filicis]